MIGCGALGTWLQGLGQSKPGIDWLPRSGRLDRWRGGRSGEESHGSGGQGDRALGGDGCDGDGECKFAALRRFSGISRGRGSRPFTEDVAVALQEPNDQSRGTVEGLCRCGGGREAPMGFLLISTDGGPSVYP